jgi:hypothetical protein
MMKVRTFTIAITLFATLCFGNDTAAPGASLIQLDSLKADVFFLAAAEMAGRETASVEGLIATNYIAAEYLRLGLKPIADGTYFQKFPMVRAYIDREKTALTARWGGVERSFQFGTDFGWYVQSNAPSTVTASLVFAGYGATAPEYDYDDYAGIDVKGKIALIMFYEPQMHGADSPFKGKWNTVHAYNRQKIENARKHGVGGLLIVREWNPIRPPMVPSGPRPAGVRPEFALASRILDVPTFIVNRETANEILKDSGQTIEALRASIDETGRPASQEIQGVEITMTKAFRDRSVVQTRNVVGLLEGSDPKLKDEVVAVTAHHDHVGTDRGRIYYGADDNASGVAGVLEIARAFARAKVRPRRSILFLVFEAEERGLLGAYHYAMNPSVPLDKTAAVLNMDMISRDEDSPTWDTKAADNRNGLNIIGSLYNPELRAIIERHNRVTELHLDYKTDREDRESWLARSDHFPFAVAGVPMVLFNTGEHPDYHTENDTWDRLNYEKMERIVRLIYLTAWDVANRDEPIPFVWK